MDCPYCNEELRYDDYFGYLCSHRSGEVLGDIYECSNEDCEARYFYVYRNGNGELNEGYPV